MNRIKLFLILIVLMALSGPALAQLSGTYFIDNTAAGAQLYSNGGQYFTSFNSALNTLWAEGVSGPVVMDVAGGQVFNENLQIDSTFAGTSPTNTITFKFDLNNKPVIQPVSTGVSSLVGVIDIRFDGDYYLIFDGLRIIAKNGSLEYRRGIRIIWGADNVTVRNCEISDFASDGIAVYFGGGVGGANNGCENIVIENNDIYHEDLNSTSFGGMTGIWVNGGVNTVISGNTIHDLVPGLTNLTGIHSIGNADTNDVDIYNNFVTLGSDVSSDVRTYGIFTQHVAGPTVNAHFNSVRIGGAVDTSTQFSAAMRLQNESTTLAKNNVLTNYRQKTSGTAEHYAMYLGTAMVQYTGDHNDFHVGGSVLAYRASNVADLSTWQAITGQDANSISVDPTFVDSTDLHVLPGSPVNNAGTPVAGITTDIDGFARNGSTPDIGADEIGDNLAPIITSTPVTDAVEEEEYSYQVTAIDPDNGDEIDFSLSVAPSFLSINENTGLITGTPTNDDIGPNNVTVVATDLIGAVDEQSFVLDVENVNDPPTISNITNQTTSEDTATAAIGFTVDDIDNNPSGLILSGSSGNTTLVPNNNISFGGSGANRTVTVTPAPNQSGTAVITVTVSDGDLTDNDNFTLTVNPFNDPPSISNIPDQTVDEGASFTAFDLDDFVSDPDNPDSDLNWNYTGNNELTVNINPTTHIAVVTIPNSEWNGNETINFSVADPALLSDNDDATFTVSAVNDTPVVSNIPNQTIAEGQSFENISLDGFVSDIDNPDNEISWSSSASTNLTITITNRVATISINDPDWNGSEVITFTAADLEPLSDNDEVTFTVTAVNDTPVVIDIPNQTIAEGGSFSTIVLDDFVADVDNSDSEITWTSSATTNLTVSIVNRVATITVVDPEWNDSEQVTFTASDPGLLSDSDDATFTVTAENDPPIVTDIPDQTVAEGDNFSTIALDGYVSDADNSDAEMTWSTSVTTDVTVSIVNRVATITANDPEWNGQETVVFTATDPTNLSNSDNVIFTVTAVPDTPIVLEIPNQTVTEGASFTMIQLDNFVTDVDNSPQEMNWSTSATTNITVSVVNRVATITANNPEWNGQETVIFTATDPTSLSANDDATFTVEFVNDPPVFTIPPDTIPIVEDDSISFNVSELYPYVEDADNTDEELTFAALNQSYVHVEFNGSLVHVSADPDWFGKDTLLLTVSDGALADTAELIIVVKPVNDAPALSLPDTVELINISNLVLAMNDYVEDADLPSDNLTWIFDVSDERLMYEFSFDDNRLTLDTDSAFTGLVRLFVTVTDDSAAQVMDSVEVKIIADPTSIDEFTKIDIPEDYSLKQNYPNPFNPVTNIEFALPKAGLMRLDIYNLLGQRVAVVIEDYRSAGLHTVQFEAGNLPSGVYFYRILAADFTAVRKMILMK